jgi:hypothetical protein
MSHPRRDESAPSTHEPLALGELSDDDTPRSGALATPDRSTSQLSLGDSSLDVDTGADSGGGVASVVASAAVGDAGADAARATATAEPAAAMPEIDVEEEEENAEEHEEEKDGGEDAAPPSIAWPPCFPPPALNDAGPLCKARPRSNVARSTNVTDLTSFVQLTPHHLFPS